MFLSSIRGVWALFFLSVTLQAQTVTGIVFNDLNRNGSMDSGEQGIANVLVSNQHQVTKTDQDGRYQLPQRDEMIVFVVKPDGFQSPVNDHNIPQIHYIHQPKGSPQLQFPGVSPTGELPKSVDFALYQSVRQDTFEVLVFGDPQPRDVKEIDYIRDDVISELVDYPAAFAISLGDIMYDDLSIFSRFNETVAQIGAPHYGVVGNHDINFDAKDDRYASETYKRVFGPPYYAFEIGKVTFIVLDNVFWMGPPEEGKRFNSNYKGKFGENQLKWLENLLPHIPEDRLIVLAMHIQLITPYYNNTHVNTEDYQVLFDLLANREQVLAWVGHNHSVDHHFFGDSLGWKGKNPFHQHVCATLAGSWWSGPKDERGIPITDQYDGVPNGYHIYRFTGNQYSERFKAARFDRDFQLRISLPISPLYQSAVDTTEIIANIFNGDDRSVVEYRINDSEWQTMQKKTMRDPYFKMLRQKYSDSYPGWISAIPSTHIWSAPLKGALKLGLNRITVKTRDPYGEWFRSTKIVELLADKEKNQE